MLISGAISQLVVGGLADIYDYRAVIIGLLGTAAFGLAVISTVLLGPVALFVVLLLIGGSLFGLYPVRDALISDITPAAYEGRTFGYIWTVALLVSSVYPFFIGYLGDTIGLQASFGTLAIAALLAIASIGLLYSPLVYDSGG